VQFPERVIEAEHLLGVYQPGAVESYPNHDEWMHVVNATTADRRGRGGGTGTYFEVEYTNGDVCDHSDVTDAAIIAGGAAAGGVIARASTVRFFCGKTYQLAVSEDSTCHYIVEVTIPALCNHPVFKEPIMKKQVVKCLPVDEDGVVEDDVSQENDESTASNHRAAG
jgi:Glucosidase II beta subunit-like protein